MKKILTLLAALLLAGSALYAQKHLEFKGIPIDGTTKQVAAKLNAAGFKTIKAESDGFVFLTGTFSTQDATIVVAPTPKTKTAWKVLVSFDKSKSWYTLKNQYNTFKESLAKKYTKDASYEFFQSPYKEGDGYETTAIYAEKCTWTTFYKCYNTNSELIGHITLSIEKLGTDAAVFIYYEDEINSQKNTAEKENIFDEDL